MEAVQVNQPDTAQPTKAMENLQVAETDFAQQLQPLKDAPDVRDDMIYSTKRNVLIPKGDINLAAVVRYPPRLEAKEVPVTRANDEEEEEDTRNGHRVLIVVGPAGTIKEQAASFYAQRLASVGFAAITFDHAHQGQSGGMPRLLEDPMSKINDIIAIVDWIETAQSLESTKIGIVGIGEGGGYAIACCAMEHRIISLGTVGLINIGDRFRMGWCGNEDSVYVADRLRHYALRRSDECSGLHNRLATRPYVSIGTQDIAGSDLRDVFDYYRNASIRLNNAPGMMLERSLPRLMAFDAYQVCRTNVAQSIIVIAGRESSTTWHTHRFHSMMGEGVRALYLPKTNHLDFYMQDALIDWSVAELNIHFNFWLV